MRREDLIKLRDRVKKGEVKIYSSLAAYDCMDDDAIKINELFYDFDLENLDQSAEIACNIVKTIEDLMGKASFIYNDFESISFTMIPKLLFDIQTIACKDTPIVDNKDVEYENCHVDFMVFFSVIRDDQTISIEDYSLEGIVDYSNFYRIMSGFGFNLPYTNMEELSSCIMEAAKKEDFPKFTILLDDEPKKNVK